MECKSVKSMKWPIFVILEKGRLQTIKLSFTLSNDIVHFGGFHSTQPLGQAESWYLCLTACSPAGG